MKQLFRNVWYQVKTYFQKGTNVEIDLSEEAMAVLINESCRTNKCINQIVIDCLKDYMARREVVSNSDVEITFTPKIPKKHITTKRNTVKKGSKKVVKK